jgi:hypothetical protein
VSPALLKVPQVRGMPIAGIVRFCSTGRLPSVLRGIHPGSLTNRHGGPLATVPRRRQRADPERGPAQPQPDRRSGLFVMQPPVGHLFLHRKK